LALVPDRISEAESVFGDLRYLSRALACVSYSIAFDKERKATLHWVAGSLKGETPVPLFEFSRDSDDERSVILSNHLDTLLAGHRSEVTLSWPLDHGAATLIDTAVPTFDRHGRVERIVGAVREAAHSIGGTENAVWMDRLSQHLDFGLSCWDSRERLVFANRRFIDLEHNAQLAIQPGLSIRAFLHALSISSHSLLDESPDDWLLHALRCVRGGRSFEHHFTDGRWIEFVPIYFSEGFIIRTVDTTTQKWGEKALREAKLLADHANTQKSRFLRSANHDLRQPLATLKILVYNLLDAQDEEKRDELLRSMDLTLEIMDEILSSLLQIGQLDAGQIKTKVTHFQASRILQRLRAEFEPQATAAGLRLRVVPSRLTIQSDRVLLERILGNFIANAIRYTPAGSVLVGLRRSDDEVRIEVWDTGIGIPAHELDVIFDEFHRGSGAINDSRRGLGLGLNISKRISALLGHPIHVRSTAGRGSVFSVSVPLGSVWQSDLEEPEITERIGGEFLGVKVLLVEDNELLRRAVCTMLERWGVEVFQACDRKEALEVFHRLLIKPDLALVDYRLPDGVSGERVLDDLRALGNHELPGIIATADNDPEIIVRLRKERIPVLVKPINPSRLRSAMHHLLFE
jgi:signal transduction histidine kinase/CheY-like chemotaxis protein